MENQIIVLCKAVGKPRPSRAYEGRMYSPVLIELPDGKEVWLHFDERDPELEFLRKGQEYNAVARDDGHYHLFELDADQKESRRVVDALSPGNTTTSNKRAKIEDYVISMARLYAHCYEQAGVALPDGTPEETVKCAASTVFIAAQRKFNLA